MLRLLLLVPFLLMSVVAQAQEEVEEIIVTGSYLKRSPADSPSPLSIIDRSHIEDIGANTVTDIINDMTYNSGSIGSSTVFFGGDDSTGTGSVNLRNLGLGSTLVLLNSRRTVKSETDQTGSGYVDLEGTVPTIAIERIEVLKDGASALYGSDAIAGVVNFITRKSFEGIEFQADYQVDDETSDQEDIVIQAIMGVQADRGGMVFSMSFMDRSPLIIGDRFDRFGQSGISGFGQPGSYVALQGVLDNTGTPVGGDPLLPNGDVNPLFLTLNGAGGSADLDCDFFVNPNGKGTQGATPGRTSCLYDFSSFFALVPDEERFMGNVDGNFEVSDSVEIYMSGGYASNQYTRRNSLFPDVTFAIIPADHPALIDDAQRRGLLIGPHPECGSAICALGVDATGVVPLTYLALQRMMGGDDTTPFAERPKNTDSKFERDFTRGLLGMTWDIGVAGWTMDIAGSYSKVRAQGDTGSDTITSNVNAAYVGLGGPNCNQQTGTAGSGNLGTGSCFYYNPFGSARVQPDGSPQTDPAFLNPDELIDWMGAELTFTNESKQTTFDIVFAGDTFELPSGFVGLAVGAQWKKEEADVDNDKNLNDNNVKFAFGAPDWKNELTTTAFFAEINIPILDSLEVNIAGRYEDFDEINEDNFDPKISALWRPTDSLSLRASFSKAFRVGSLLQLFGNQTTLTNSTDPYSGLGGLAFRPSLTSGNSDLSPEKADVYALGLTWEPVDGFLEGFGVDLDYYAFEVDDLLTRESHQATIDQETAARCPQGVNRPGEKDFDAALPVCGVVNKVLVNDPNADPDAIAFWSQKVIRTDIGGLIRTETSYLNAQKLDTSGVDLNLRYAWEWGAHALRATMQSSYTIDYDLTDPFGVKIDGVGSSNSQNTVGHSLPEYKINWGLFWNWNRMSANLFVRYIDGYDDDRIQSATRGAFIGLHPKIDDHTTADVQFNYELPAFAFQQEGSVVTLGIKNVTDEDPPFMNIDGAFDPFVHDPRGRLFYFSYRLAM